MKKLLLVFGILIGTQAFAATVKYDGYIRFYNPTPSRRFGSVGPFDGPRSFFFMGSELVNLSPERQDLDGLCVTFEVTDGSDWAKNVTEVPCK